MGYKLPTGGLHVGYKIMKSNLQILTVERHNDIREKYKMTVERHIIMNLKEYLKNKGIPILSLSRETGIPRTTLEDIVNGKVELSDCKYRTLKKISDYTEIPIDVIVEENGVVYYPIEEKVRKTNSNNVQGCCGVSRRSDTGIYRADITYKHKSISIGTYKTFEEAVIARKAAERIIRFFDK